MKDNDGAFIADCLAALEKHKPTRGAVKGLIKRLQIYSKLKREEKRRYKGPPKGLRGIELCRWWAAHTPDLMKRKYEEYLQSEYWRSVRDLKLANSSGRCEYCGSSERLHVHHEHYRYKGREYEHLDCLSIVCEACHQGIHGLVSDKEWHNARQQARELVSDAGGRPV